MWLIVGLLAGAVVLSLVRQQPLKEGEELLRAMEEKKTLRTAMMVFDYRPGETEKVVVDETVRRGMGTMPGGLQADAGQRWMVWRGGEFIWREMKEGENPLRVALGGDVQKVVARAVHRMGYYDDAVWGMIRSAMAELDAMTDEALLMAWVRADRGMMAEADELPRAVREGLLLAVRENGGAMVVFEVGGEVVYLLPMEGGEDTWVTLEAFREGRMVWRGTLRMQGRPAAEVVRGIAARVAREAVMNGEIRNSKFESNSNDKMFK